MIGGVVAASGSGSGGSPYEDSLLVMDFILGEYWVGSTEVAASTVIDNPSYITASGLQLVDTHPAPTHIIGAALSVVLGMEWTIVMEWLDIYASDITAPFSAAANQIASTDDFWTESTSTTFDAYDAPAPGADREASRTGLTAAPVIRRAAITRTSSKLAVSVNGSSVTSDTTASESVGFTDAAFGGRPYESFVRLDVNIRRFIVYPVQSDAALPGLSTV